jgi:hypothetical protein
MRFIRPELLVAALAFAASPLAAQSIYLDCGAGPPTAPSSAYGAAAGIPGYWNTMPNSSSLAMLDVFGQPTTVVATAGPICDGDIDDFPNTSGDDGALLDDWFYADCYDGQLQIDMTGLRAGTYQLYLYPLGNGGGLHLFDLATSAGGSIEGGSTGTTEGLGPFTGSFTTWHVPVRLVHLPSDGSFIHLHGGGFGLSGLQIVRLADATTFCSGDQGWCPCGVGLPGAGCPSSFAPGGAALVGSGSMQVSSDSLQLTATSLSSSIVTFFQGTTAQNLGIGSTFGDGLRCAGGSVIRLASVQSVGGVAQYPRPGDRSISVRGALPATGGFRTYQVSYRNSIDYCTSSTFNLTNGVAVEWRP